MLGIVFHRYLHEEEPSKAAQDEEVAERLWNLSEKMVQTGKSQ